MSAPEHVQGTPVLDGNESEREALPMPSPTAALAVTPAASATDLVARLDVIRDAADRAMVANTDYGVIPGTDKPTLLKPGAEKLSALFQLDVQTACEKRWGPGDHLTVEAHAIAYHAPTGLRLGSGEGVCSTRERKYAYRKAERECPTCGQPTIIKGKQEFGGGWLCWKKRGGCGAKFADDDQRITSQQAGEVDNPDLPDVWNTVTKMAKKRALIDAVLLVTGASAVFTQDMEDHAPPEPPSPPDEPAEPPAPAPKRQQPKSELDGDTHKALVAAIRQAKVDGDWVRWHLIGVGLQDVPEKVTPSVLKRLSLKQANEFLFELSAEVDRRNETDGD